LPARVDLTVLGRKLGTYTSWDDVDWLVNINDNFEPAQGVELPAGGTLTIDYANGYAIPGDPEGNELEGAKRDLATLCASLPRR